MVCQYGSSPVTVRHLSSGFIMYHVQYHMIRFHAREEEFFNMFLKTLKVEGAVDRFNHSYQALGVVLRRLFLSLWLLLELEELIVRRTVL